MLINGVFKPSMIKQYESVKRMFDVLSSFIGLVLFSLPMIIISILIYGDSKGPILYKQERLGKNGVPFIMYKFRSMRLDAESEGPRWAEENDERCTEIGKFLRNTRLDELPQLWNILRGDMSFVGPRPERAYFYREFKRTIPDFYKRLQVIPGLTGYAQVNGGYDLSPEEKLQFDLEYINRRSIGLDLLCMIKTVRLIFTHEGAR
ncbi:MAG: sugar transferase [Eubacteriales bacterium]|nr:sugar transferase [Eubacteriales bacterium]